MVITLHAIAATWIAVDFERLHVKSPNNYPRKLIVPVVCLAAFCSHFLLDAIPHYDYWIYGPDKITSAVKILADLVVALTVSGFVLKKQIKSLVVWANLRIKNHRLPSAKEKLADLPLVLTTLAAITLSLTPDALVVLSRVTGALTKYRRLHDFFHSPISLKLFWGTAVQLLVVLAFSAIAIRSRSRLNREVEEAGQIERGGSRRSAPKSRIRF